MALKTHLPPLLANDDAGTGRACFQAGGPEGGVMHLVWEAQSDEAHHPALKNISTAQTGGQTFSYLRCQ